ncbi:MAG: UDP-N-acetylmuramoyl-L-alanine--D-glutamate ligase, partial [Clostridia bacterium]|nr:UDP-N-acetylmuramoyl-L-alanine--D-glutamate ligase [Clostridia bacterium]
IPLLDQVDAVVISPGVPVQAPVVKAAQAKGLPLIGELELAFQLSRGDMVAVTGTNGKTTTVSLLGEIFKNAGKVTHVVGNIGYPYSLAAMEARDEDMTVCEVSSFQLETTQTFRPRVAAVLNITEDHLNRHGTMEEYIRLKARIFEGQQAGDTAVLNFDDPTLQEMAAGIKNKVIWFSRTQAVPMGAYVEEGKIICTIGGSPKVIADCDEICIPGPHNLENALAAVCVAAVMGVPAPVIRHTLRTFKGVEHRIEFVRTLDEITYLNDSKGTNVDSTLKAIQTMKNPTVIILGGYDKHCDFAPLAEEMVRSPYMAQAMLIGETAPQIEKALKASGYDRIHHAATMQEAVEASRALAPAGGTVLLSPACASFDMFKDYEERGRVFKDIVNQLT